MKQRGEGEVVGRTQRELTPLCTCDILDPVSTLVTISCIL